MVAFSAVLVRFIEAYCIANSANLLPLEFVLCLDAIDFRAEGLGAILQRVQSQAS